MALRFKCPSCQNDIIVRSQRIGDQVMCQQCGVTSVVPESAQTVDPDMLDYLHQQVKPTVTPAPYPQMPPQPLSSEDFGAILRDSFGIPFTKIPMLFLFTAIYAIPIGIFGYLFESRLPGLVNPSNPLAGLAGMFKLISLFFVMTIIVAGVMKPAFYVALVDHILGRKVRFSTVIANSALRVPWVMLGSLIIFTLLFVMTITIVGFPFAIYFSLSWMFVEAIVTIEQVAPPAALSKSYELVKGVWWRLLGLLLVVCIAAWGVVLIPLIVAALLPEPSRTILKIVCNTCAYTIVGTGVLLAYLRLKFQKQNFDLNQLAELRDRLADPDDLVRPIA